MLLRGLFSKWGTDGRLASILLVPCYCALRMTTSSLKFGVVAEIHLQMGQGRNPKQEHEAEIMEEHLLPALAGSATIPVQPRLTCPELALLMVGWAFLCQLN